MSDYVMLMKALKTQDTTSADWQKYIEKLIETGKFRGGSAFGSSLCVSASSVNAECVVTGFMRFEAESIDEVACLVAGNPVYEAGGEVELHELVVT